jgi:8-amino-7-oxononanoate synthase
MTSALDWIRNELDDLAARDLRRSLGLRSGSQAATIVLDQRHLLNFGSNDYLGLASDRRICEAVGLALKRNGWGAGASPLLSGRSALHAELERHIAAFEQTEAALLFPTGYAANAGTISALVGRDDLVLSDAKNHASIIDGCRLSGARIAIYPHNNVDAAADMLKTAARRRLIVTDGLFSMDGDMARLEELVALAHQFDAMLMVDEAHSTGVFGTNGRGVAELMALEDRVDIRVGTLSKAIGSMGGFVAGPRMLIDWLANRARPFVFSTAAPAALCAAGIAAFQIVRDEPFRREKLLANASFLRAELIRRGLNIGQANSQIIPVIVGSASRVMDWSGRLRDYGVFVPGIRPPSVPAGESLLRISLSYAHARSDIDRLLECFDCLLGKEGGA